MKTKDYFQQIAEQEKKSSEIWRLSISKCYDNNRCLPQADSPASPEEIKESYWQRVLNRDKTDAKTDS